MISPAAHFVTRVALDRDRLAAVPLAPDDRYLYDLPVVKHLDTLEFPTPITFFVGENGTGKSTLIEAIAVHCGFNAEGGSRNFTFSTRRTHSALYDYLTVTKGTRHPRDGYFLRAESFYNVATELEKLDEIPAAAPKLTGAYGGQSLHAMSHGESFFSLMTNRFFGNGLYLLDEPEAALSVSRLMAMISLITELSADGSQFIISTHSPILLACPNATIYELGADAVKPVSYRETENYRLTKQFLDNPERMVRYLTE